MLTNRGNWAGNYEYRAAHIHEPEAVEQVQELVRRGTKLKALGTRHSFNDIADSPGDLISLRHFKKILDLDRERRIVKVEAGVRYGELCRWLDGEGFALHNLASLPHISIAGACATATHGSGNRLGNLATAVTDVEVVTADGEIVRFARGEENFNGAVVGLGGLGVVTRMSLEVSPNFQMQQDLYENLPLSALENNFDDLFSSAYSVSLFTDWSQPSFNQLWLKQLVPDGISRKAEPEVYGAKVAARNLHPIGALSAENCTEQMGVVGAWYERLPHFRLDFTPSSGEELQSEYLLPREHAVSALHVLNEMRSAIAPLLLISEVRTIAADALWMSTAYDQDSVALHFTWKQDWEGVRKVLPVIEERLAQFKPRPHWGKLFTMSAEDVQSRYPRLPDFRRLLEQCDPEGKFRNVLLDKYIFEA